MPTLTFTEGNDNYTVDSPGTYNLSFLGGDDILTVNGGDFTSADMGSGNDRIRAILGQASVDGGAGADRYDVWAQDFFGDAGLDNDLIYVRGGYNVVVLGAGGADIFTVYADVTYLTLAGGDGNDVFFGRGHALLYGAIVGDAGDDRFFDFQTVGGALPQLQGGTGNDRYRFDAASPPDVIENANAGIDAVEIPRGTTYVLPSNVENLRVLSISGSTSGAGTLVGNQLNNIIIASINDDQIQGLDGNDWLYGKGGNDVLDGGAGKNHLDGGDGIDQLIGGGLRDVLDGGAGDDTMSGGLGDDAYYVDGLGDTVLEDPGAGTDIIWSSAASYNLPTNIENGAVQGSAGVNLGGNSADNVLTGGTGNDTLNGYDGNDVIRGGAGADNVSGGNGDDRITGGAGADILGGQAGADTFFYNSISESPSGGADRIYSFSGNNSGSGDGDVIDLSAIDADPATIGDQPFSYRGGGPTMTAGDLWITVVGSNTTIFGDVNGDGAADFQITFVSLVSVDPGDIVF